MTFDSETAEHPLAYLAHLRTSTDHSRYYTAHTTADNCFSILVDLKLLLDHIAILLQMGMNKRTTYNLKRTRQFEFKGN